MKLEIVNSNLENKQKNQNFINNEIIKNQQKDQRLFFQDGYEESSYFKYICYSFAKNFFKEQILSLDKGNVYFKKRIIKDIDPILFKKEKEKYNDNMKKVENDLKNWRENHIEYYRNQPSLPSSSKYIINIPKNIGEITLENAIQGYKAASEALDSIDNADLSFYCTETKLMLKSEYKEIYKEQVKLLKEKYGVPEDEEIKSKIPLIEITKTRLSLDRSKSIDKSSLTIFEKIFKYNILN